MENKFKYSLDFLKKFNSLRYRGEPLSHQKIFGKYNVWIFFQSRIFFNELREFVKDKQIPLEQRPSFRVRLQNFVMAGFGLLMSFLGLSAAVLLRKKTLVYGIDRTNSNVFRNDSRMDPVYQYLKSSGLPFLECLHTTYEVTFVKRFFKRRRLVLYIKSIDTLFHIMNFFGLIKKSGMDPDEVDLTGLSPEERAYTKWLLHRYFAAIDLVVFKVKVLRKILFWTGVETLLAIDNTRDYWELVLACRMNGIKMYAFQHGHFTKYHVGWLNDGSFDGEIAHPDKLFVWSEFWKKELLRLGTYFPADSIEVGGLKNVISTVPPRAKNGDVGILIPYEVDSDKVEMKKYIDKLLSCGDIKVFFKLRTDTDAKRQMEEYSINEHYNSNLLFISDVVKHLADIDVVLGTYSTFLYDMVAFERPIGLLETKSDFGEGLVINGLAERVLREGICERVKEIARTTAGTLRERREKLFGEKPFLMYDTVQRICSRK